MKRSGRIFVFSLSCIMLLILLSCEGKTQTSGDSSEKITVRLGIWPEDTQTEEIELHTKVFVPEFQKLMPNVNLQPAYYNYQQDNFVPMAEAGQTPTIFSAWFTEPNKLIDGKFVKDITDEVNSMGWDTKMNSSIKDALSRNGRLYGLPAYAYCMGLVLNLDLFEEAGLMDADGLPRYPKTWDELGKTGQIIKQKTGQPGFVLCAKDQAGGWHFSNMAWSYGAEFEVQKDGKWVAQINTPEVLAALQMVWDLRWKYDCITPEPTNETFASGYRAIGTGTAAMYMGSPESLNMPTRNYGLPLDKVSIVPMPSGPKGQYSLMGGRHYFFAANATSDQVKAALKYLEIMGVAPVVNDQVRASLEADAARKQQEGTPVVQLFPAWESEAYLKMNEDITAAHANVDLRQYADFYAKLPLPGFLKSEEPYLTQDLYSELTKVLQAVVTDKNADLQALLDVAQANLQKLLDSEVNR